MSKPLANRRQGGIGSLAMVTATTYTVGSGLEKRNSFNVAAAF